MSIDRAVLLAAHDIADSIDGGKSNRRRAAIKNFLEAALWAAASAAERLPSSLWIDPRADDSWLKTAADVDSFPLPETMTPQQFMEVSELLGTDKEALEKMIGTRIKLQPELKAAVEGIVGSSPSIAKPPEIRKENPSPAPAPEHRAPIKKEHVPRKELEEMEDSLPPKRKEPMNRDEVAPRKDEFEGDITNNPALPGAPEIR